MSSEIDVMDADFDNEVLQSDKPVIVDFWAPWCGPCMAIAPVLAEYASLHPNVKVCKVNVDDAPAIAQRYNVMSIPTIIFFNSGQAVETAVGSMPLQDLTDRAKRLFGM